MTFVHLTGIDTILNKNTQIAHLYTNEARLKQTGLGFISDLFVDSWYNDQWYYQHQLQQDIISNTHSTPTLCQQICCHLQENCQCTHVPGCLFFRPKTKQWWKTTIRNAHHLMQSKSLPCFKWYTSDVTNQEIQNQTGSCSSVDYRWKFQYFTANIERTYII